MKHFVVPEIEQAIRWNRAWGAFKEHRSSMVAEVTYVIEPPCPSVLSEHDMFASELPQYLNPADMASWHFVGEDYHMRIFEEVAEMLGIQRPRLTSPEVLIDTYKHIVHRDAEDHASLRNLTAQAALRYLETNAMEVSEDADRDAVSDEEDRNEFFRGSERMRVDWKATWSMHGKKRSLKEAMKESARDDDEPVCRRRLNKQIPSRPVGKTDLPGSSCLDPRKEVDMPNLADHIAEALKPNYIPHALNDVGELPDYKAPPQVRKRKWLRNLYEDTQVILVVTKRGSKRKSPVRRHVSKEYLNKAKQIIDLETACKKSPSYPKLQVASISGIFARDFAAKFERAVSKKKQLGKRYREPATGVEERPSKRRQRFDDALKHATNLRRVNQMHDLWTQFVNKAWKA